MSYRGPDTRRIRAQQADIFQYAGQTAVWRQYISASAGVAVAGLGSLPRYREQVVTALFGRVDQPEHQTPAGMFVAAEVYCVTREPMQRRDELLWRGVNYRVDTDPAPGTIAGTYTTILKRGS